MGIISKIRGTIVHNVFEFVNGATLTSTSTTTNLVIASSGFRATTGNFTGTFLLPYTSTTSTGTAGMVGYSTSSAKMVIAVATGNWVIVSTS